MDDRASPRPEDQKTAVLGAARPVATSAASPDPPPVTVGHFRLLEALGQGGYGTVHKALDEKLRRVVAVKMLLPQAAAEPGARERFVREARAAAAVRHENVVQIYAVEDRDPPYIVMEYVPGGPLSRYLMARGALPPEEVLRVGAQAARGLAAAHACGLVHRDVKPANILLDRADGRVKLTDFGIARVAGAADLTAAGAVLGTPLYMSPEQARGEALDGRSDLYSLGTVLFQMASGRTPFSADGPLAVLKQVAEGDAAPLRDAAPDAPDWLCALVDRLHAPRPAGRFASAAEAAEAMEGCLVALERGRPVPPSALAPAPAPARPRRWFAGTALTAALALAVGTAVVARHAPGPAAAPHEHVAPGRAPEPDPPAAPPPALVPVEPGTEPVAPAVLPDRHTNALGMTFARVPRGSSQLGGGTGRLACRPITVPADFYLGTHEVTRAQWERALGPCPTDPPAGVPAADVPRLPVTGLCWDDCQQFVRAVNRLAPEPGWAYRLPRAGEWEYAARGGPGRAPAELVCDYYAGEPTREARPDRINCRESGLGRPARVGSYPPNRLGLYDLHGNADEFLDTATGAVQWLAGGGWSDPIEAARAWAYRGAGRKHRLPAGGLRLARVPGHPDDPSAGPADPAAESVLGLVLRANPRFRGDLTTKLTDGYVTEVHVADGSGLVDLAPFASLRRLKVLSVPGGEVRSLAPLKGLPLEALFIWGFAGGDLSPLRGMPLVRLNCGGGGRTLDLDPLKGMPLRELILNHTGTADVSPLAGMPLTELGLNHTRVENLSALGEQKALRGLRVRGAPVADLGPLRGFPLEELELDDDARHAPLLRALPALRTVNGRPAAEVLGGP